MAECGLRGELESDRVSLKEYSWFWAQRILYKNITPLEKNRASLPAGCMIYMTEVSVIKQGALLLLEKWDILDRDICQILC